MYGHSLPSFLGVLFDEPVTGVLTWKSRPWYVSLDNIVIRSATMTTLPGPQPEPPTTTVPEPSTALIMLGGALVLSQRRRLMTR